MKINITKRFLLSLCLMTLTLLCGENKAWAAEQIYTHTFAYGNFGTNKKATSYDATLSKVAWSVSASPKFGYLNTGSNTYAGLLQIGSQSDPCKELKLETSAITGTIKSITLNACAAATRTVTMSVGGTSYLCGTSSSASLTASKNDYTFSGSSSGTISISISGSSKALYLGSIKIVYEEVASTPAPTFSLPGGTYYGERSVSISVDGTGSILYTTNGDDPKTKGNAYTGAISLPVGTKNLTLKAVAKYGEGLFSDVTEATYDIQKAPSTFYQRITSADELTENGSYLIVCESESVAFGEINSSDKGTPQAVTITDDKIYLSAAGTGTPTEFILEVSEKNYKLKNASTGDYIIFPNADKTNITELSTPTTLIISFNEDKSAVIKANSTATRQILYHTKDTNSNYYVFGYYASKNAGNADYAKVYLYKKHVISDFTFSDTEDLKASLPETELADQTVTLDRYLYSGWNTFCVPFALTQAQLEEAYGSGAVAKYLSGVTTGAEGVTLHFTPEEKGGIEANKAYLLYLTADVTEAKTFSGVTLEPAGTCTTTVKANNNDVYTFQGILKPTTLTTNGTQYFLNSAGTYFVLPSNSTSAMKATRAYITVPTPSGSAQGRQYSFDFNGTTTGIDNVNISGLEDGSAWYTISGIRVNRPAAKGVYIHNGRKVIVK